MVKIIIVFFAAIACAAAKPSLFAAAPLAAAPVVAAPLAAAPVLAAAPLAYANAHLDAAYAAHSVDIRQNYNAALLPATYAAAVPAIAAAPAVAHVAPLKYTAAAPLLW